MCREAAVQVGCPAHTTQSVQTTRADTHAGGAKLQCSYTCLPTLRFVCFPKYRIPSIAEIGARTRQYGVQDASQPAHKEQCSRLPATYV